MPNIGIWDWLIIFGILLLLFGAKKLPELARGVGRSIHSFKKGLKEVESDFKEDHKDDTV